MEAIQIFHNDQFGDIRTAGTPEHPLFNANDIAKMLGYSNSRDAINRHCKGVVKCDTLTDGGIQSISFISESDVYRLVMRSKIPQAEQAQDWVVEEVLPAIRKQGGYMIASPEETPEQIMARALLLAQSTIDRIKEQNRLQSNELIQLAPKVDYFDTVLQSTSTYVTDQIAKELGMTAIALNKMLAILDVQFKRGEQWVLTAKYVGKGYTKTKTYTHNGTDGLPKTTMGTVWTEAGRKFIHDFLKAHAAFIQAN